MNEPCGRAMFYGFNLASRFRFLKRNSVTVVTLTTTVNNNMAEPRCSVQAFATLPVTFVVHTSSVLKLYTLLDIRHVADVP